MKKTFKNHPFKVGDRVYHPVYGWQEVIEVFSDSLVAVNDLGAKLIFRTPEILSFTEYEINSNWERPFKDGDIIKITTTCFGDVAYLIAILNRSKIGCGNEAINHYVGLNFIKKISYNSFGYHPTEGDTISLATEAEKQELFDALAKKGKRWNAEKKVIEDIDDLTVQNIDIALRLCDVDLSKNLIEKILKVIKEVEQKGGNFSLKDAAKIR